MSGLKRISTPFGRLYYDGANLLPSVTNILSHTEGESSKAFLTKFARDNKEYCDLAKARGTAVHKMIEVAMKQGVDAALELPEAADEAHLTLFFSFYTFIENTEPVAIEHTFFSTKLGYAGTIDYLGIDKHSGIPILIDWKTTIKPKKYFYWGNYPVQLSAYIAAANELFKDKIGRAVDYGLIIRACTFAPPQMYHLDLDVARQKYVIFQNKRKQYFTLLKHYIRYSPVHTWNFEEEAM